MARQPTRQPPETTESETVTDDPRRSRSSDILLTEIAKIQTDGEHIKSDLGEMRTDIRDLRDRMARLETEVKHLPSKEFIVTVVVVALGIIGGLLTIAPKLQSWAGTTAPAVATAPVSAPTANPAAPAHQ
jgi:hypothetical protein